MFHVPEEYLKPRPPDVVVPEMNFYDDFQQKQHFYYST